MEDTFSLRHVVHDVLTETDLADPSDVANAVLARIPEDLSRVALAQALRGYVRQVIGQARMTRPEQDTEQKPTGRSWKRDALREGWRDRLHDRTHVENGWKLLAECTYEDLLAAAAERRDLAERNLASAQQYEKWASLVSEYGVETFGDLPAAVLAEALGRAA